METHSRILWEGVGLGRLFTGIKRNKRNLIKSQWEPSKPNKGICYRKSKVSYGFQSPNVQVGLGTYETRVESYWG